MSYLSTCGVNKGPYATPISDTKKRDALDTFSLLLVIALLFFVGLHLA